MKSLYLVFKGESDLFSLLTYGSKGREEVIYNEDPIATWMKEAFEKIKQ